MHRLILILLLLSACGSKAPPPQPPQGFRDAALPISSTTRLDPARLAGDWTRVAAFAAPFTGCPDAAFATQGAGLVLRSCGDALPEERLEIAPNGRLLRAGGAPLWVLWVDEDHRTLVIGTPDGSFGWVLNRGGAIPPDRWAAAREVLEFNGYDLARLARVVG